MKTTKLHMYLGFVTGVIGFIIALSFLIWKPETTYGLSGMIASAILISRAIYIYFVRYRKVSDQTSKT